MDVPATDEGLTRADTFTNFEDKVVTAVAPSRLLGVGRGDGAGFPHAVTEACGVAVSNVSATDAALSKREDRLRRIRGVPSGWWWRGRSRRRV